LLASERTQVHWGELGICATPSKKEGKGGKTGEGSVFAFHGKGRIRPVRRGGKRQRGRQRSKRRRKNFFAEFIKEKLEIGHDPWTTRGKKVLIFGERFSDLPSRRGGKGGRRKGGRGELPLKPEKREDSAHVLLTPQGNRFQKYFPLHIKGREGRKKGSPY